MWIFYQLVHSNALHLQILKASPLQCKNRQKFKKFVFSISTEIYMMYSVCAFRNSLNLTIFIYGSVWVRINIYILIVYGRSKNNLVWLLPTKRVRCVTIV